MAAHAPAQKFTSGTGVPSNGVGASGDWYLDTAAQSWYQKVGAAWAVKVNGGSLPQVAAGYKYVASTGVAATDTAAIQAAHDAFPAGGGTILLDSGPYAITADTVNFTKPTHLIGMGPSGANVTTGGTTPGSYLPVGSKITCSSSTGVAIAVNADGCTFEKLYVLNTSVTPPSAGAGMQIQTHGLSTRIVDCAFEKFYNNVEFLYGYEWFVRGCQFFDPVYSGLKITDAYNGDAGDGVVADSFFIAGPTNLTPVGGIRWESSGGLRIHGCKVNGRGSGKFTAGFDFKVADGVTTEGPFVSNCSIENVSYGIDIGQLSTLGVLNYTVITGCQFGSISVYGIRVSCTGTGGTAFQKQTITGNVLAGTTAGIYLAHVNYPTVGGNTEVGGSTPNLITGSGVNWPNFDHTVWLQGSLTGTTAGTVKYTQPVCSAGYKKIIFVLNGYENTTITRQSIPASQPYSFGFATQAVVTHDDTGATTYDTQLRLPISMGAPVTGIIIVEGY